MPSERTTATDYDFYTHHELIAPREKYVRKGLSGLINLGNKCFMNSAIQCLSNTLKLTDYFFSSKYKEDDPEHLNHRKSEYHIVTSYINLLVNIWENNQLIKPRTFNENISKLVPKYYSLQQQDSHECLMYILDILHRALSYELEVEIKGELKTPTDQLMKQSLETWKAHYEKSYSYIIELFNGMTYDKVVCSNDQCNKTENVFEPFNSLCIDIPKETSSLQACLKRCFTEDESVATWKCESCSHQGCTKKSTVWTLPNYLIIQLKRFNADGSKNSAYVEFPFDDLDLTEYICKDKKDPNIYLYTLYAVNYHSGGSRGGHCYAACKNLNGSWYLFNDGDVTKYYNTGDMLTKDAYVLFYHRKYIKAT